MTPVIIDVREPEEFLEGHVEGALSISPDELIAGAEKLKDVPKDAEIVLYCLSGSRSNASMYYLREMGYENLVNGINKEHVKARYSL